MTLELTPTVSFERFTVPKNGYDTNLHALYDLYKNIGFEGTLTTNVDTPARLEPKIVGEDEYIKPSGAAKKLVMFYTISAEVEGKPLTGTFEMPIKTSDMIKRSFIKHVLPYRFKQDFTTKDFLYSEFIKQFKKIVPKKQNDFIERFQEATKPVGKMEEEPPPEEKGKKPAEEAGTSREAETTFEQSEIYNEGNKKKWRQPEPETTIIPIPESLKRMMEQVNQSMALFDEQGRRLKRIEKQIQSKSDLYDAIEKGVQALQLNQLSATDEYPVRFVARLLGIDNNGELTTNDVAEIRMSIDDMKKKDYKVSRSDISKLVQKVYKAYAKKPKEKLEKGVPLTTADKRRFLRNIKV